MLAMIVIGEKGNLSKSVARRRAKLTAEAIRLMPPYNAVELVVYGYDDDSREVWNIPEVRNYFIAFVEALIARGIPLQRLLPHTQDTVAVCYAVRAGRQVVALGTHADTVNQGIEQAVDHIRMNLH
jgi:hypothetical protein